MDIVTKEQIEVDFWTYSQDEGPQSNAIENILEKMAEARIFLEKLKAYRPLFEKAESVLELGGGQCWASCMVKRMYPHIRVTATDIAPDAIASIGKWERIYECKVDSTEACRSYDTPFADQSFDLIFAYSAAHHFVRHRSTLVELHRILRNGGSALYLHEPSCNAMLHSIARARVNRNRPEVPEDVLVTSRIAELARMANLQPAILNSPTLTNRLAGPMIYYYALRRAPVLQRILPVTADFMFTRPA
jgi:SAM-dependent methyltransferase